MVHIVAVADVLADHNPQAGLVDCEGAGDLESLPRGREGRFSEAIRHDEGDRETSIESRSTAKASTSIRGRLTSQ